MTPSLATQISTEYIYGSGYSDERVTAIASKHNLSEKQVESILEMPVVNGRVDFRCMGDESGMLKCKSQCSICRAKEVNN